MLSAAAKDDKSRVLLRTARTLLFLISMATSFLFLSAPLFFVALDLILPHAIIYFSSFHSYNRFTSPLLDIPLISALRSVVILASYCICDAPTVSRGIHTVITTVCSVASLVFLSVEASSVLYDFRSQSSPVDLPLLICSIAVAVAHVVVAYRRSCRERRRLLVFKIDIEAVESLKNGFMMHGKVIREEKTEEMAGGRWPSNRV